MNSLPTFEVLRKGLEPFSDETTSLYIPMPQIQSGGEKWRILQKNVASALTEHSSKAARTLEFVEKLDLNAFRGSGMAIWEDKDHFRTNHLGRRPFALLDTGANPFMLPVLADLADRHAKWVLALDLEKPVLYFSIGNRMINQRPIFDAPKYEDVEARRDIQNDVFFHSSSRGGAAGSKFHSLGVDRSGEEEKTTGAFYHDVIDALEACLPPQVRTLHVAGDPGVVGEFCKLFTSDHLSLVQHHGAGEALEPERLLATLSETVIELEPMGETISSHSEIGKKAELGQIERLYVSEDLSLLESRDEDADEHLRVRKLADLPGHREANEIVAKAIATGAKLDWRPQSDFDGDCSLAAILRWEDGAH